MASTRTCRISLTCRQGDACQQRPAGFLSLRNIGWHALKTHPDLALPSEIKQTN
jgi:hypothetical protein